MGLFRKKQEITFEEDNAKTPVRFRKSKQNNFGNNRENNLGKKSKRRKIKRAVILTTLLIIVGVGSYFGIRAYNSIKNVFAEGTGLENIFKGGKAQSLKSDSAGRTNILLLGVGDEGHDGATLSDTMIIVSYDSKTKYLAMFSIPRDLYVQIPGYESTKINAAHAYGEQFKVSGGGPGLAKQTVEKTFGVPIHYFVRVDFSGLQKLVDALGGVPVDVENSFCDYAYPTERKGDTSTVCFTKGSQTMNGTKALQYSRSRHAYGAEGSDFARSKRQQRVLMAIKDKALSANTVFNPKKVLEIIETLGEHIKMDFQISEFATLYDISKEVNASKIISRNFDNSPQGMLVSSSGAAGYFLQPVTGNFKEIQEVVKNIFQIAIVKNQNASIQVQNGSWNTGLATRVADSMNSAGFNVVKSQDADTKNVAKTVIYDYSGGKKAETLKALEKYIGVTATAPTPPEGNTYDFVVVLGKDYRE